MFTLDLSFLFNLFSVLIWGLGKFLATFYHNYNYSTDEPYTKQRRIFFTNTYTKKIEPILKNFFKEYYVFFAESLSKIKNLSKFIKSIEKDVKSLDNCEDDSETEQKKKEIRQKIKDSDIFDNINVTLTENQMKELHTNMIFIFKFKEGFHHVKILKYFCYIFSGCLLGIFLILNFIDWANLNVFYFLLIVIFFAFFFIYALSLFIIYYNPIKKVIIEHTNNVMIKTAGGN